MWAWCLNTAWMLKCAPERIRSERASRQVRKVQEGVLFEVLHANRHSEFGRRHSFAQLDNVHTFQERVPVMTYADYAPYITRIAEGQKNVLTTEPVLLLEPTSGTSGGAKLIPYTAGLRRQFQRGVSAWIANLFYHRPAIRAGRAYWSISPALGPPRRSPGGLPIGFDDDAAYLGRFERFALRKLLVRPDQLAREQNMTAFRRATLGSLLAAEDLTLISVWSPTFLTTLLSHLEHAAQAGDVRVLATAAGASLARGNRLEAIWNSSSTLPERLRQTWPQLALISCWTDAAAGQFVPQVRSLFPEVEIQPKGLLATEGFVSLPLVGAPAATLALRCHFFEFEELSGDRFAMAHELEQGSRYRVVLTTAGGLYRYQLRDEIEVVGFHHECPLVQFIGKSDLVSDLVGEKLAEAHVRAVLNRLAMKLSPPPRFQLLVPVLGQPPCYRLYVQGTVDAARILEELQRGLEENPYYRHAVELGQLGPVEIGVLDDLAESAWLIYEQRCLECGQKAGDIKPAALDRWTGWPERLAPLLLEWNSRTETAALEPRT